MSENCDACNKSSAQYFVMGRLKVCEHCIVNTYPYKQGKVVLDKLLSKADEGRFEAHLEKMHYDIEVLKEMCDRLLFRQTYKDVFEKDCSTKDIFNNEQLLL